ncbi:MAG: transcription initiation factor IIB family protein [Candidatus Thorarchaeota archaeon]
MNNYKEKSLSKSKKKEQCCENKCVEVRNGQIVCINCGMVFGTQLTQKERRAFTPEELRKRKRTQIKWRNFGPRTILSNNNVDSTGHHINAKRKPLFKRLSKIQRSLTSGIERNLWDAKPKMKLLVSKLNIPEYVYQTAWRIYISAAKQKLTMGRSIDGFVSASLYAAIRVHEIPRLLEEICEVCIISRRTVIRSLEILIKEILPELNLKYKPITPEQLIFRFGNKLKIPIKTQKKALDLLKTSSKKGLSTNGKNPKGFAASAIYMAAKLTEHRKTQTEVSDVAKITEVTLRTRVKDIKKVSI